MSFFEIGTKHDLLMLGSAVEDRPCHCDPHAAEIQMYLMAGGESYAVVLATLLVRADSDFLHEQSMTQSIRVIHLEEPLHLLIQVCMPSDICSVVRIDHHLNCDQQDENQKLSENSAWRSRHKLADEEKGKQ